MSQYSFYIVTSGRFEWACHDTIECIVAGEQGRSGRWLCHDTTQPGLRYGKRKGSRGLGTVQSQSAVGEERTQFVSPHPSMGQRDQYQSQGAAQEPSTLQTGHISQD